MTEPGSDQIFDSFLEEMLTNQHPPDLTEQIQQRLREERGSAQVPAARVALRRPSVSSGSHVDSSAANDSGSMDTRPALSRRRSMAVAALTLSAGLLVAVGVRQLWLMNDSDDGGGAAGAVASNHESANTPSASGTTLSPEQALTSGGPAKSATDSPAGQPVQLAGQPSTSGAASAPPREDLSLENLPFAAHDAKPDFAAGGARVVSQPVKPWSDDEVVAWLNQQFKALWDGKQIQPAQRLAADAEAARVSLVLTGGALPASNAPPRELASKLLQSATFAEHWADRVVTYWLRGTPAADKRDEAGARLRAAVAQQIVAHTPWNEIVAGLIGSQPGKPEAAFLAQLAGGDNHRLAGRVGSAVLDEALACARCHDASDNGRLISTDQDEFWSLVAIFSGIETRDATSAPGQPSAGKELVDRQPELFAGGQAPHVFFDRPDGRLQAAHYRLPGGDNWRSLEDATTPRESLARWIASSSVTDHAAVNTAWRLVYGRPLVAQHAALDGDGWAERREVLDTLAQQFEAHGRDISKLVGWLIASEPFRTQPLTVDRQKWLLASDKEIARWNVASVNFATFKPASTSSPQLATLEGALASVVRWSSTRDERRATLAQPTPAALPGADAQPQAASGPGARGAQANDSSDDVPATYLVHSFQPSAAQTEFIKRLVSSKLTWPQQVEHIAGLVGESSKEGKLQQTADQLLELKNGDRSAALFQLLQSALLCQEAL